jgi:hypothetical protein
MIVGSGMNSPIEGRLIDRLVDDELTDSERRELLVRLETDPEGWRRCALAFLESQSWHKALAAIPAPAPSAADDATARAWPVPQRRRRAVVYGRVAAGILLAFLAGCAAGRLIGGHRPGDARPDILVGHPSAAGNEALPPLPREPGGERARQSNPAARPVVQVEPFKSAPRPERVTAPVAQESESALNRLVRQWERRGYEFQPHRDLMTVRLKDGREVAVPIEGVRVQYVGNRTL